MESNQWDSCNRVGFVYGLKNMMCEEKGVGSVWEVSATDNFLLIS